MNDQEPESPSIVTENHIQNRNLSKVAGAGKGWTHLSPLSAGFLKKKLSGKKEHTWDAHRRYVAGEKYSDIWDASQSPSRDHTQALNVSSGGYRVIRGSSQVDAIRRLEAIHRALGPNTPQRYIIEAVCGKRCEVLDTIRTTAGQFEDEVWNRFREALDTLHGVLKELGYL